MFAVDDIDDSVARLHARGAELPGEVAQYESIFRFCYRRDPAGIIVALPTDRLTRLAASAPPAVALLDKFARGLREPCCIATMARWIPA